MNYTAVCSLLMTFLTIAACGNDEPLSSQDDDVILATSDLYDTYQALPYSYIVTFRSDSPREGLQFSSFAKEVAAHLLPLQNRVIGDPGILDMRHLAAVSLSSTPEVKDEGFISMPIAFRRQWTERGDVEPIGSITQVDFASAEDAVRILNIWKEQGRIWFAEPNYTSQNHNSFGDYVGAFENTASRLYWHEEVNSLQAIKWLSENKTLQAQPIIAVMDSGVDPEHPSLRNRLWRNESIGAADCSNDLHGCNTTSGKRDLLGNGDIRPFAQREDKTCPPSRENPNQSDSHCSHGTHVAGIIAGFESGSSNQKMMGICPMCRIMAIQIISPASSGPALGTIKDSSIIRGLHYVGRFRTGQGAGVRVLNASFGKFQRSRAVGVLIRNLYQNGTLVVAAAGNEDTMLITFPAGFRDVLAVSNIHTNKQKHSSSNFGAWVDIAAPGGQIESTIPGSPGFEPKSGTSMSAPVVAGVAGLMLAAQPDLSPQAIRNTLIRTADPKIYSPEFDINNAYYVRLAGRAGRIPLLGSGMVNALAAVKGDTSTNVPIATARTRVDGSCGIAGGFKHHDLASRTTLFLMLLLPLGIAMRSSFYYASRLFWRKVFS